MVIADQEVIPVKRCHNRIGMEDNIFLCLEPLDIHFIGLDGTSHDQVDLLCDLTHFDCSLQCGIPPTYNGNNFIPE